MIQEGTKLISILLAKSQNNVIGKDNQLPWHISEDLRYFKKLTTGKTVVMGRKTFESIGKALPKRENYVLTHNRHVQPDDVHVIHSIEDIKALTGDVFIIGGASLIKKTVHLADRLYLTEIHRNFDGDITIDLNMSEWKLIESTKGNQDGSSPYSYDFNVYERIR